MDWLDVRTTDVFALLENTRAAESEAASVLLFDPVRSITARDASSLAAALDAIDEERRRGHFVCGYLTYEAGYYLCDRRAQRPAPAEPSGAPLLEFYAFRGHLRWTTPEVERWLARLDGEAPRRVTIGDFRLNEDEASYRSKLEAIKRYIRDGDTYQVNFTLQCAFQGDAPPLALYRALRPRQRVEFGAYLNLPGRQILSCSPELFLRKSADTLIAKPMKGTAVRGASEADDRETVEFLKADPKTLSENVMIVDLLRNDLGRVARFGSVAVENLFEVQTFETLHQMISTVRAHVAPDLHVREVMRHLFPCGSITGAPKVRTMEIIEELEAAPRGVYTGALGYLTPTNDFCFSVAIRTIVCDGAGARMGIGSGIIDESSTEHEFAECLLKARFVTGLNDHFQLIETMRFDAADRQTADLEAHLARLAASARYFHFAYDVEAVRAAVAQAVAPLTGGLFKLRLLLAQRGAVDVTAEPIVPEGHGAPPRVIVSDRRVDTTSWFQYHKTTKRELYEAEHRRARALGAYDVIFLNERDELAEASRHNVFIVKDGRWMTPPRSAGILSGIARARVLRDPELGAVESTLTLEDLYRATAIYLTNSVRGVVRVSASREARPAALQQEG